MPTLQCMLMRCGFAHSIVVLPRRQRLASEACTRWSWIPSIRCAGAPVRAPRTLLTRARDDYFHLPSQGRYTLRDLVLGSGRTANSGLGTRGTSGNWLKLQAAEGLSDAYPTSVKYCSELGFNYPPTATVGSHPFPSRGRARIGVLTDIDSGESSPPYDQCWKGNGCLDRTKFRSVEGIGLESEHHESSTVDSLSSGGIHVRCTDGTGGTRFQPMTVDVSAAESCVVCVRARALARVGGAL